MKAYAWLCAGMFCTGVLAGTAGIEEYRRALVTQEGLRQLSYEILNSDSDELKQFSTEEKEAQLKRLNTFISDYREQLRVSAAAGFAPGQYLYAVMLKAENMMTKPSKTDHSEICQLLNDASMQGFLAAGLGRARYCNSPTTGAIDHFIGYFEAIRTNLQSSINRQDPYGEFYPVKAFARARCFEPDNQKPFEEMNPLELFEATQPPLMELDQFKAETHFQLASLEPADSPDRALQHLTSALELGCSITMVEQMQRRLTQRK